MGLASGGGVTGAGTMTPPLGADPIVVGGGVLAVVAAAGILLFVRVRTDRTRAHQFRAALAVRDEVAVLTHSNPDPDALACALAVRELAEDVGTDATIHYPGEIRHEENQPRGFAGAGGISPYAVVDHHPGDGEGTAFTDVRPSYGACASLLTEYLRDLDWQADGGESALPASLATALVYGIRSDTAGFTRGCTTAEFDAAAYCSEYADPDVIERVATPPLSPATMEVRARAVLDRVQRGAFVCTHAGTIPNPDTVAQAADDLLRMEGVRAVVVAGRCDGTLHLSGRATEGSAHIGEALSSAIEGIPMADAGGHERMGGGQLSVDHMAGLGPGDGVSIDQLFESIFAVMASHDPEGASEDGPGTEKGDRRAADRPETGGQR